MNDIIYLIAQSKTVDEFGDPVISEEKRAVFAEMCSIGAKEFYQAKAVGMQPELKFRLQDYLDYDGEMFVEYNGVRYKILRSYRASQRIELTCYREVNINGSA